MEIDPDYTVYAVDPQDDLQEDCLKILEENAREAAVGKIKNIINEQFDKEIRMKENELRINQKLADAGCVMDRLRACVVASFYAASFTKPVDGANGPDSGAAYHPAIQNVMRKAVTSVLSKMHHTNNNPKKLTSVKSRVQMCQSKKPQLVKQKTISWYWILQRRYKYKGEQRKWRKRK